MIGKFTFAPMAAALVALSGGAALAGGAPHSPGIPPGGYNPGYFSSYRSGYYPGYVGPSGGGYNPGYFSGSSGFGAPSAGYYPGYFSSYRGGTESPAPNAGPSQEPAGYGKPSAADNGSGGPYRQESEPAEPSDSTAATDGRALVIVTVPADAALSFSGQEKVQHAGRRVFRTPPLPPGEFTYEIRARWEEGGHPVEQTRTVPVRANGRSEVDFTKPDPTPPPK